jgi:nucleolar protein 56
MEYILNNVIGSFILDDKLNIIQSHPFENLKGYEANQKIKSDNQKIPKEKLLTALTLLKDPKNFSKFYEINLQLTKQSLKESVNEDNFIIQTIGNIYELDRVINLLSKRSREWYSLYLPELSEKTPHHQRFIELVASKNKEQLMEELRISSSMGADLKELHIEEIKLLAKNILNLYELREKHEEYLKKVMQEYCPNVLELAGATIGAKLLEYARTLRHMALLPASTIQLLGAEKALFRHLKTGCKSPKHGIIIQHPLIQKAKRKDRGKVARSLADKISLCARLDYFKGEFKGAEYKKALEEKFK